MIKRLTEGAAALGVPLSGKAAERLIQLLGELERWNRAYNLTAIRDPQEMLTHHLLDSLSIHPDLKGERIADVGTGAGFPGLPLAIANPQRHFTLIDSNNKKVRFVEHAVRALELVNVQAVHGRAEGMKPEEGFDCVVSRGLAPLRGMLGAVAGLCGPDTRVLAMKGRWPRKDVEDLPAGWEQEGSRELVIPGLNESRCVIVLRRSAAPSSL